jgi:hypothetical protein
VIGCATPPYGSGATDRDPLFELSGLDYRYVEQSVIWECSGVIRAG